MKISLAILVFLVIGVIGVTLGGPMYDHSRSAGDEKGPVYDDEAVEKTMTVPFMYYGQPHLKTYVNENGVLSFLESFWEFIPEPLPDDNDFPLVLPFWGDIDIGEGGKIWTRVGTDSSLLNTAAGDIQASFANCHNNFQPTEYVIATWKKVLAYCYDDEGTSEGENVYQVVLVTDGVESYVIFNYHRIEWLEGCPNEKTVVGFNSGDGRFFELPGSSSLNVGDLQTTTNANRDGRWIYKVSGAGTMDSDCDPVENYECECHGTNTGMDLTKYDLESTTLAVGKYDLTGWQADVSDVCKFKVVAAVSTVLDGLPHDPYVAWIAIYVGVHEMNQDKFHANWRIGNGEVLRRGQGYSADTQPIVPITMPAYYVSPDGETDLHIVQEGDTFQFHSTLCPFAFHVTQDAANNGIISDYDLWVSDKYQDGNLSGECGTC